MALSADTNLIFHAPGTGDLPVKATSQIYKGSAVGVTSGYARALVAGDIFGGFSLANVLGLASDGLIFVPVQRNGLVTLTITSLAVTDIGKMVYASADGTFTLTQSTNTPIGPVHRWIATGSGVIAFNADRSGASGITLLTAGTNITARTATAVLVDSSATNPSDVQFNQLAKDLYTKLNEVINALK